MRFFDPPWLKLHHRICDRYEAIAFRRLSEHSEGITDVVAVSAAALEKEIGIPTEEATALAKRLHADFRDFSVRAAIEDSLRSKNSEIPEEGITEIYEEIKQEFLGAEHWHVYFLYFVISFLLTMQDYGIERGDYLIRIVLNTVPEDNRILKVIKRTFRFASYLKARDKKCANKSAEVMGVPLRSTPIPRRDVGEEKKCILSLP